MRGNTDWALCTGLGLMKIHELLPFKWNSLHKLRLASLCPNILPNRSWKEKTSRWEPPSDVIIYTPLQTTALHARQSLGRKPPSVTEPVVL
jgi:hypothetical protein